MSLGDFWVKIPSQTSTFLKAGNAKHSFQLKRKSNQTPFWRKNSCGLQEWVRVKHNVLTNQAYIVQNWQEAITHGLTKETKRSYDRSWWLLSLANIAEIIRCVRMPSVFLLDLKLIFWSWIDLDLFFLILSDVLEAQRALGDAVSREDGFPDTKLTGTVKKRYLWREENYLYLYNIDTEVI